MSAEVLLQIGRRPPEPGPASHPGADAELRFFRSSAGRHVFVADGSRIYDLPEHLQAPDLTEVLTGAEVLTGDGSMPRRIDGRPIPPPPLSALSLNVLQACNMSCGYCYADEGRFGGAARAMAPETARAAVDRLLAESRPGADVVIGFMGGEPLLASDLVHDITAYATRAAARAGRRVRFALTTNLTTVTPQDARLFAEHPFAVSVSVDGERDHHDTVRRMHSGASAYDQLLRGLEVLRRHGRPRHLAARVTVTPRTGRLLPVLEHIIGLGFDEVGFAAVLVSPDPALAFRQEDFPALLAQVIECGEVALAELSAGRRFPFGNFETAMHQIHRGSHRPYPCGAGAGYLSAGAEGDLFACHRLVDDPGFAMGSVQDGLDHEARTQHLTHSHVDRMQPCRSCWARYLCGGGCYHEVSRRGRPGCDYIRGWLEFCLRAYVELSIANPEYFSSPLPPATPSGSDPTTVAR